MKKEVICMAIILSVLFSVDLSYSQTYWAKVYGIDVQDYAYSAQQTSDGGYIVAGETKSYDSGYNDFWVLKLDSYGGVTWEKTYGGDYDDSAYSIQQTSDGGYIVEGVTGSYGAGNLDLWVLKLNNNGDIIWEKTYGGIYDDWSYTIQQTSDGGYVVAGNTTSFESPVEHVSWVLKLDSNGGVIWGKTYIGVPALMIINSIRQTSDGGYIVVGEGHQILVMKLDSEGNVTWVKDHSGTIYDIAHSVQQTSDGGYIVAGGIDQNAGLLKLDSSGNIIWQKTYGGNNRDRAFFVKQTNDNGYIIVGNTRSFGAGGQDCWLLKLDSAGNILWEKTFGGTDSENVRSVQQTSDGGYIIAGNDDFNYQGYNDFLVLKLDSDGDIADCDMIGTSTATVANSSVTNADESVSVGTWSHVVGNTSVTVTNTNARILTICEECTDWDDDGICVDVDVCPNHFDPLQRDTCPPQGNNIGDACDCEGNFDCDSDCDGSDAATFKLDFGRSPFSEPCEGSDPCCGDFDCDNDCDGTDAALFKTDFGRNSFGNPCPVCEVGIWCIYP